MTISASSCHFAQYEMARGFAVWVWHYIWLFSWKKIQTETQHIFMPQDFCLSSCPFLTQKYAWAWASLDAPWFLSP